MRSLSEIAKENEAVAFLIYKEYKNPVLYVYRGSFEESMCIKYGIDYKYYEFIRRNNAKEESN